MRKYFFVLTFLILSLGCGVVVAEQVYQSANFEYALLFNGDAELIRYLGEDGTVIIPNGLDGHPIVAVRGNPFTTLSDDGRINGVRDCVINVAVDHPYLATINGVLFGKTDRKLIYCPESKEGEYTIPQGIRSIGDYAFYNCSMLKNVTIPGSVMSIGEFSFYNCGSLTSVTLPDGVTEISSSTFCKCKSIKDLSIPSGVTIIGDDAFHGCASLSDLGIPDTVTMIGELAFGECTGLHEVTIPSSVKTIGQGAFLKCSNLQTVRLHEGLMSLGSENSIYTGVFAGCSKMTEMVIPDTVTYIGSETFKDCESLKSITIPASVTKVEDYLFIGCRNITDVAIPDSVVEIGEYAFMNCTSLRSITIPKSVISIGEHAFDRVTGSYPYTYAPLADIVFTITPGSYAETWCMDNGQQYVATGVVYGDTDDWLNAPYDERPPYKTVGSYITFGHYEQDGNTANGPEPIEWLVLDYDTVNNRVLLLSRYGLDTKPYNEKWDNVTWETCTLRAWLNKDFQDAAFSRKEQSAILTTIVDNSEKHGYSEWDTNGGNNTQDKIFLLSFAEANKYLGVAFEGGNNVKSRTAPTAYLAKNGIWTSSDYQTADGAAAGWWWLRSPGTDQRYAARVDADGSLTKDAVNYFEVVRPAFWLSLDDDIF